MDKSRIEDNPSFKKLAEDICDLEQMTYALPFLKPFLRLFDIQANQIETALAETGALGEAVRDLSQLPDRFNALLAARGWIMYDLMNVAVAQSAIAKAEANDIDGAERILADYYDETTLRWLLTTMNGVKAFQPHMRLARLALDDYLAGRYHSCVPVVLARLDGMVSTLSPKVNSNSRRGFFAEGSNLEAWDSIAGHNSGLTKLAEVLRTNRTKNQNNLPDRNGITHGDNLDYDNQLIAAKCWAALFATREWALKVEQGMVTAQAEKPKPTWKEIFRQIAEDTAEKKRLDAWIARDIRPGRDIPTSGEVIDYETGSPERKLVEFLSYWRARNYGFMADRLPYSPYRVERGKSKVASQLREHYRAKQLKAFTLIELEDEAPAITVIKAQLVLEEAGEERESIMDFRLVYEDSKGHPAARGKPDCAWVVLNYFA